MRLIDLVALNAFPLFMIYAAFSDLFSMKISNWVSIGLIVIFLPLAYTTGFELSAIGNHFLCGLATLVVCFAFFSFNWMGGGDAKIAAATALWFGWSATLDYVILSSIFGGIITLVLLGLRRFSLPQKFVKYKWIVRLHQPTTGVPYGIALAIAAICIFPNTPIWLMVMT